MLAPIPNVFSLSRQSPEANPDFKISRDMKSWREWRVNRYSKWFERRDLNQHVYALFTLPSSPLRRSLNPIHIKRLFLLCTANTSRLPDMAAMGADGVESMALFAPVRFLIVQSETFQGDDARNVRGWTFTFGV